MQFCYFSNIVTLPMHICYRYSDLYGYYNFIRASELYFLNLILLLLSIFRADIRLAIHAIIVSLEYLIKEIISHPHKQSNNKKIGYNKSDFAIG